jgi:asparagine synthetase B (glutamine-hydrolysing)
MAVGMPASIIDLEADSSRCSTDQPSASCNGGICTRTSTGGSCARAIFRTASDTETIVHLYEGKPAVCRSPEGMFAFCIWDMRLRRVLARDRGHQAALLRETDNALAFASGEADSGAEIDAR